MGFCTHMSAGFFWFHSKNTEQCQLVMFCVFVVDVQCNKGYGYQLSSLHVDAQWLDTEDGCFVQ